MLFCKKEKKKDEAYFFLQILSLKDLSQLNLTLKSKNNNNNNFIWSPKGDKLTVSFYTRYNYARIVGCHHYNHYIIMN